jgi:membrane protein
MPGLLVAVARRYWSAGGPNWAAAVGLRLLLALLPIAVLAGLVIQEVLPQTAAPAATTPARLGLRAGTRALQNEEQSLTALLSGLIGDLHQSNHTLGILSVLGLLWIGSGLFACMESATAALYGTPGRRYLRQRALGIALVIAFAAMLVAGILSSVLLFPLGAAVQHTGVVGRSAVNARLTLQPIAGVLIGVALFALVFRVLPTCRQRWLDVLPGVVIAAAGNTLLNLIWPVYLRYAASTLTVSYVVFGFVVAIATYASLLAQVVVLSLALNATLRQRRLERTEAATALATATG